MLITKGIKDNFACVANMCFGEKKVITLGHKHGGKDEEHSRVKQNNLGLKIKGISKESNFAIEYSRLKIFSRVEYR
jgi:hypothetical protein